MGVKITAKYIGNDNVEVTHLPTGDKIITDLPVDNGGKGRTFSPTDLLASAVASCILTIMGVVAKRENINIEGSTIEIEKHMAENPRRVSKLVGKIKIIGSSEEKKKKLVSVIKNCPVSKSLHPDIELKFDIE
ncbi:MAG: OsmC family protein [Elusimicrobiota bacterium]